MNSENKKKGEHQNRNFTTEYPPNFSGQHLIQNKGLIKDILKIANISEDEIILELGAGKGAITTELSKRAKKVLAVEYDQRFIEKLKQLGMKNTFIIEQDILKIFLPREHFVVVSNIPYAITTPIMKMLLNKPSSGFQRGIIIIEEGAAKRFTSSFVKDSYIVSWKMWFDIRYVKGISRKNFSPQPRVDSAMITINRKAKPLIPYRDYLNFGGLVDYALKSPLLSIDLAFKDIFTPPQIKFLKRSLQIKTEVAVATLSEQQWSIIFETMVNHVPKFKWPKIKKVK